MNKHITLRSLDSVKAFYLGQLEGQLIRNFGRITGCTDRTDDLINTLNYFDFSKKLFTNYEPIAKHSTNAKFIADYLCVINWMSHIYAQMAEPSTAMKNVLKNFFVDDELEYFKDCCDYYCFAYEYLYTKFRNDRTISDEIKSKVYYIND